MYSGFCLYVWYNQAGQFICYIYLISPILCMSSGTKGFLQHASPFSAVRAATPLASAQDVHMSLEIGRMIPGNFFINLVKICMGSYN